MLVLRSVQGGVAADYRYELSPTASGATRVRLTAHCQTQGLLWQSVSPLLRMAMKRVDGEQIARLRKLLEDRP